MDGIGKIIKGPAKSGASNDNHIYICKHTA